MGSLRLPLFYSGSGISGPCGAGILKVWILEPGCLGVGAGSAPPCCVSSRSQLTSLYLGSFICKARLSESPLPCGYEDNRGGCQPEKAGLTGMLCDNIVIAKQIVPTMSSAGGLPYCDPSFLVGQKEPKVGGGKTRKRNSWENILGLSV